MQEFSAVQRSGSKASIASSGIDYPDIQAPRNRPSPGPPSFSSTTKISFMTSPLSSDRTPTPRRSLRIARRWSVNQKFPTLSVLSQVKQTVTTFVLSICVYQKHAHTHTCTYSHMHTHTFTNETYMNSYCIDTSVIRLVCVFLELQRSDRPLQDKVQTTKHPEDYHAFRVFSTPTPLRPYQVYSV